jgi:hypothetical protein
VPGNSDTVTPFGMSWAYPQHIFSMSTTHLWTHLHKATLHTLIERILDAIGVLPAANELTFLPHRAVRHEGCCSEQGAR